MEGMGSRPSDSFQISSHSRFQHSHSDEPRRGCLVQGESTLAMQHEPILDSPAASDQGRMPFLAVPTHASDLSRHPITSGHTSSVTSSLPSLHAAVEVLCSRGCQAPASFVALAVGLHADTNSAPCSALQILKFSTSRTPHVCVSCSPRCAGGPSLRALFGLVAAHSGAKFQQGYRSQTAHSCSPSCTHLLLSAITKFGMQMSLQTPCLDVLGCLVPL